ncbi:MAG: TonB-dependent receptor [Lentisphaerae bacterium]|jgi:iron complex outermembrane recepter protein|nr:TonB-dependent receptor [Lentisphaerota bacterium]MBT4817400.1 TonB-dependent receptor [Lentisphaerota bacterium]MBT5612158.1 TonB-dependent receptor [Lentisphaerota bacterium]MBT7061085.1 TonB-dependent receptor [Lentisphaerota bacterium]MBT7843414.1 TonB-dependent receptor [Lentisphaerota bacterium]
MNIRRAGLLVTALLTGLASAAAHADEDPQQLRDMVVTATRSQVAARDISANVTVISSEDIAKGNYSDVVSVLKRVAGLHFRSFSGNQEAAIDIRGFGVRSHTRVLVLRDGRKLNRPDQRSINWSQIPLANVERIEIIHGPSGAVYGDHAVGGVINIITKKGAEDPTGEVVVEGGSNDMNRQALSTVGSLGDVDYALSLERAETAGWRDRTGTRTEGADLSLGYDLSDDLRLDVSMSFLQTDYEMPGSLNKAQYEADPRAANNLADEAVADYFSVYPTLTARLSEDVEFILDLGYSSKEIETDQPSFFTPSYSDLRIETLSTSPRLIITKPVRELANRLTLGVDVILDAVDIERYADAPRAVYTGGADVSKDTLAMYVNDALHLSDALTLSAGVRLVKSTHSVEQENAAGAVTADDDDSHREEAYQFGLTWNATEETKLFARYERFYRLPTTDEQIAYSGFGVPGFNKDLVPETGDSYEFGVEQQISGDVTLTATVFRMEMQDEITDDFLSVSFNSNLDETVHQGVELSLRANPSSSVSLYANYTLQDVEFSDGPNDGNEIPLVPKHKLGGGIEFRLLEDLRMNLAANYTSRMNEGGDIANGLPRMDDYVVVDLGLAYGLEVGKTTWEIFGAIDNLFEEDYAALAFNYGFGSSYYPAPGRTYKVGMKASF